METVCPPAGVGPLLSAAARNAPLRLKATEPAYGSGAVPPTGVRAPEDPTEKIEVPEASSAPLELYARLDTSPVESANGEPGAGVNAGELARAAAGVSRKRAARARHRPNRLLLC
jgi:hypothetical protein